MRQILVIVYARNHVVRDIPWARARLTVVKTVLIHWWYLRLTDVFRTSVCHLSVVITSQMLSLSAMSKSIPLMTCSQGLRFAIFIDQVKNKTILNSFLNDEKWSRFRSNYYDVVAKRKSMVVFYHLHSSRWQKWHQKMFKTWIDNNLPFLFYGRCWWVPIPLGF